MQINHNRKSKFTEHMDSPPLTLTDEMINGRTVVTPDLPPVLPPIQKLPPIEVDTILAQHAETTPAMQQKTSQTRVHNAAKMRVRWKGSEHLKPPYEAPVTSGALLEMQGSGDPTSQSSIRPSCRESICAEKRTAAPCPVGISLKRSEDAARDPASSNTSSHSLASTVDVLADFDDALRLGRAAFEALRQGPEASTVGDETVRSDSAGPPTLKAAEREADLVRKSSGRSVRSRRLLFGPLRVVN